MSSEEGMFVHKMQRRFPVDPQIPLKEKSQIRSLYAGPPSPVDPRVSLIQSDSDFRAKSSYADDTNSLSLTAYMLSGILQNGGDRLAHDQDDASLRETAVHENRCEKTAKGFKAPSVFPIESNGSEVSDGHNDDRGNGYLNGTEEGGRIDLDPLNILLSPPKDTGIYNSVLTQYSIPFDARTLRPPSLLSGYPSLVDNLMKNLLRPKAQSYGGKVGRPIGLEPFFNEVDAALSALSAKGGGKQFPLSRIRHPGMQVSHSYFIPKKHLRFILKIWTIYEEMMEQYLPDSESNVLRREQRAIIKQLFSALASLEEAAAYGDLVACILILDLIDNLTTSLRGLCETEYRARVFVKSTFAGQFAYL